MTFIYWLVSVALASGGFAAAAKKWKFGPFLEEMSPDSPLPAVPSEPEPPLVATTTPSAPIVPPNSPQIILERFCHAIEAMEGGPGDANHRNNNPGNVRCSPVGYLAKYGSVKCSPAGFAVFPTYQLGWEYLMDLVHHRAVVHPTWTILDFFKNYSPSEDGNDPVNYAKTVAKACGTVPTMTLAKLFA